ncbi:MAG: hypothetical protein IKB82_04655 [Clostridia bacterium]|nr:hypothetical protein [Clostridia bacterium]
MNYDQKGYGREQGQDRASAEAKLFEEILNRLDAKQNAANMAMANNQPKTIDLIELFYYCLSRCYIVIIGALIGAVLMGASAKFTQPVYTATSKLYIVGQTGMSVITDLQIGSVLTLDYQEVFKTWEVHQMVNEQLNTAYPYSMLQSMVSVTNPEDTRVLYITAYHTDAQMAADIANAYAVAAKRFITETMLTDEPTTFSIALVPSVSIGKSMTNEVIKGFLLGTVLAGGLLVLAFVLDNRPKSPEDIMNCAGIPTLAVIPVGMDRVPKRRRTVKKRNDRNNEEQRKAEGKR